MVAAGGLEADAMKTVLHGPPIPAVALYVNSIVERSLVDDRGLILYSPNIDPSRIGMGQA